MPRTASLVAGLVVLALAIALGALSTSQHILTLAIQTMMLAALASSWNILGGLAGQISLGHAAFFGLGALITRELWLGGTPLAVAATVAVLVTAAAAAAVGVPMLRFREIYFAVGTLALGVAVFLTVGNLHPGISSLPAEALRTYSFTGPYFMTLGVLLVTVFATAWLKRSKAGLGMMAVRDDEHAAAATGVNAFAHKMVAFVLSAALAALTGAAFGYFSVSYFPNFPFHVIWTFEAILVVFVGGIGTIAGPLIGSVLFVIGRDALSSTFAEFQVVLFGLLFIVVTLLLPGGLAEAAERLAQRASRRRTDTPEAGETTDTKGKELV